MLFSLLLDGGCTLQICKKSQCWGVMPIQKVAVSQSPEPREKWCECCAALVPALTLQTQKPCASWCLPKSFAPSVSSTFVHDSSHEGCPGCHKQRQGQDGAVHPACGVKVPVLRLIVQMCGCPAVLCSHVKMSVLQLFVLLVLLRCKRLNICITFVVQLHLIFLLYCLCCAGRYDAFETTLEILRVKLAYPEAAPQDYVKVCSRMQVSSNRLVSRV